MLFVDAGPLTRWLCPIRVRRVLTGVILDTGLYRC